MRPVLSRLVALAILLAGLAATWFPLMLGLLMFFIGAQQPDPSVPDGDPCCGHPDTWWEVLSGVGFGALCMIVALGPLTVAAAAVVGVAEGRPPRWIRARWVRRLGIAWALAVVAAGLLFATG